MIPAQSSNLQTSNPIFDEALSRSMVVTSATANHGRVMARGPPYAATTNNLRILPGENRTGPWTLDEKILFLHGLRKFGKGKWKDMSIYLPTRSPVQIKSHAQKVLKRLNEGENVYRRMEENQERLKILLAEAHARAGISSSTTNCNTPKRNSRVPASASESDLKNSTVHTQHASSDATATRPATTRDINSPAALCPKSSSDVTLQTKQVQGNEQGDGIQGKSQRRNLNTAKGLHLETCSASSLLGQGMRWEDITEVRAGKNDGWFDSRTYNPCVLGLLRDRKREDEDGQDYSSSADNRWYNIFELLNEPLESDSEET